MEGIEMNIEAYELDSDCDVCILPLFECWAVLIYITFDDEAIIWALDQTEPS
jgi:hypothetical protein